VQSVSVAGTRPLRASGDFVLDGVNAFRSPSVRIEGGGDLRMTSRRENARMELALASLDLADDLVYQGSDDLDAVELGPGAVTIGGSIVVELRNAVPGAGEPDSQAVRLRSGAAGSLRIRGRASVRGGDAGNPELVEVESGAEILRGLRIALGDGTNQAILKGGVPSVQVSGGAGRDSVTLGLAGRRAKLALAEGEDRVLLVPPLALGALSVDFGAGIDSFEIGAGAGVPDAAKLTNLP
jgi:hypothetical protein